MTYAWWDGERGSGSIDLDEAEKCLADWGSPQGEWQNIGEAAIDEIRSLRAEVERLREARAERMEAVVVALRTIVEGMDLSALSREALPAARITDGYFRGIARAALDAYDAGEVE